MKKMMRTVLAATMAFAILLLPGCGGSDDAAQAPEAKLAGDVVSTDFAPAVDGVLTLKMANAGIIINDTGVAMPYTFDKLAAAGIQNADDLRSIEMGAGDFYSVNMFLDENEDYLVLPYFYNDNEEAAPITEVTAEEIGMAAFAEEPVDQNVSILGVKFGMTKAEATDLLGAPSYDGGDYWEYQVVMEDSNYEGYFTLYFTSDAEDAVVSQADLDITDYGF